MSIEIDQLTRDSLSIVLYAEDQDEQATALLLLIADYVWDAFGMEVSQDLVVVTMVFPEDSGEHVA